MAKQKVSFSQRLRELLGTGDKKEQTQRIEFYRQMSQMPVVDIIVRFDGRLENPISVGQMGPEQTVDVVREILREAERHLERLAREAIAAQVPSPEQAEREAKSQGPWNGDMIEAEDEDLDIQQQ